MPTPALRLFISAAILLAASIALTHAADPAGQPVAPGKFIPTFAVKYGGSTGWPELRDAAKYDLIVAGTGSARPKADPALPGNTWQVLKKMNPNLVIVLYQIGPAEYNTADWGRIGQGWKWIMANHGPGSSDRWMALGEKYGTPLQSTPYPNERLMLPGNPNWQQYWLDSVYAAFWGDPVKPTAVADGIFSDNTRYSMIWKGQWRREGHPETPDIPAEYYQDGKFNEALYHQHMKNYFARAFPWMAAKGRKLVLNFGDMVREPETWTELDNEPSAPFGAMEEGAFVHPWTSKKNTFVVRPEKEWLTQVETMRKLRHVRALMNVHGPVVTDAKDFSRMEASDARTLRGPGRSENNDAVCASGSGRAHPGGQLCLGTASFFRRSGPQDQDPMAGMVERTSHAAATETVPAPFN